jgi:hypothetical protein
MKNVAIASLIVSLAGCSGAAPTLPPAPPPAAPASAPADFARPDTKAQLLYVGDSLSDAIYVYNAAATIQQPPPVRVVTDGIAVPNGIAVDASDNLYVSNDGANSVTKYAPNGGKPVLTINSGIAARSDIAVDAFGNVYVSNNPENGPSFVSVYAPGAAQPNFTWTAPSNGPMMAITLLNPKKKGGTSLYAMMNDGNPSGNEGQILYCAPKVSVCQVLPYSLGYGTGIAMVESPNEAKTFEFLAADQRAAAIDTFVAGNLTGQLIDRGGIGDIALNAKETRLFVSEYEAGTVTEYSFPAERPINTFAPADGGVGGVAVYPPAFH